MHRLTRAPAHSGGDFALFWGPWAEFGSGFPTYCLAIWVRAAVRRPGRARSTLIPSCRVPWILPLPHSLFPPDCPHRRASPQRPQFGLEQVALPDSPEGGHTEMAAIYCRQAVWQERRTLRHGASGSGLPVALHQLGPPRFPVFLPPTRQSRSSLWCRGTEQARRGPPSKSGS